MPEKLERIVVAPEQLQVVREGLHRRAIPGAQFQRALGRRERRFVMIFAFQQKRAFDQQPGAIGSDLVRFRHPEFRGSKIAEQKRGAGRLSEERRDMAIIAAALDYVSKQRSLSMNQRKDIEDESRWRMAGRPGASTK